MTKAADIVGPITLTVLVKDTIVYLCTCVLLEFYHGVNIW